MIFKEKLQGNSLYKGKILSGNNFIKFVGIPIITPTGEKLIDNVSLMIKQN